MHLRRWLTAIVAVPVLIYVIGFGHRKLFHALLLLFSMIGLFEYFRITSPKQPLPIKIACFILTFFLFYFFSDGRFFFMVPAVATLWVIVPFCLYLFFYPDHRSHALEEMGKIVLGLIYICLPLGLLIFIDKQRGNIWIFFLLLVIFMTDTGAFYFGRIFGKHKLFPSVSPGKTWEGAIGGFLCSLLAAFIFSSFFPLYRVNVFLWILAAALSILCQVGDLAESMLKRNHGVKDSGKILPGHGGVLDRIDGLLFAVPILYIFLTWPIIT